MVSSRQKTFLLLLGAILSIAPSVYADEYSATNFRVLDPVLAPGSFSSSTGFQLFGSIGEPGLGTSTASSFGLRSAFLYFPVVSTPVVTATAGDSEVDLSWAAVTASLGWTVSGYNVGQATVSGGPYSYSSLGNVTLTTRTGLTNSTAYYFVIRAEDAFGNSIATSTEVAATPVAAPGGNQGNQGGSGGGGSSQLTEVNLAGLAFPNRPVTILIDGIISAQVTAGSNGQFEAKIEDLDSGTKIFGAYSEDVDGRLSKTITFPVTISSNESTVITGIFIPPTISSDKEQVKLSETITFFGQGPAFAIIELTAVGRGEPLILRTISGADGRFRYQFKVINLPLGQYETNVRGLTNSGLISQFGKPLFWSVGDKTIQRLPDLRCPKPADLNGDCRVNLADFSILVYWLNRANPPSLVDLKPDGKIDLKDFGVAAYYWTG